MKNQGVSEVGDEVRADFCADHGSVLLANTKPCGGAPRGRASAWQPRTNAPNSGSERKESSANICRYATQFGWSSETCSAGEWVSYLEDLGITRKLSHRAQRLAEIPAKDFDWYLRTAAEDELEITTRLLLYHSERRQPQRRTKEASSAGASPT